MLEKIKKLAEIAKELIKLAEQLEKLVIRIVSLFGWIVILVIIMTRGN